MKIRRILGVFLAAVMALSMAFVLSACGSDGPVMAELSGAGGASASLSWPEGSGVKAKAGDSGLTVTTPSGTVTVSLVDGATADSLYAQVSGNNGFTDLTVAGYEGFGYSDMATGNTLQCFEVATGVWVHVQGDDENAVYAAGEGLSVSVSSSGVNEFQQNYGNGAADSGQDAGTQDGHSQSIQEKGVTDPFA